MEDNKLFLDIAVKGGRFHVDSQTLVNYRAQVTDERQSQEKLKRDNFLKIQNEILDHLIENNQEKDHMQSLLKEMNYFLDKKMIGQQKIPELFSFIFMNMKLKEIKVTTE